MGFLHDLYTASGRVAPARVTPYVFGDKGAYVSPMDRTLVDGRTSHKEHMRKHGVVEAGDMKLGETSRSQEPQGVQQDIKRAIQEVASR